MEILTLQATYELITDNLEFELDSLNFDIHANPIMINENSTVIYIEHSIHINRISKNDWISVEDNPLLLAKKLDEKDKDKIMIINLLSVIEIEDKHSYDFFNLIDTANKAVLKDIEKRTEYILVKAQKEIE